MLVISLSCAQCLEKKASLTGEVNEHARGSSASVAAAGATKETPICPPVCASRGPGVVPMIMIMIQCDHSLEISRSQETCSSTPRDHVTTDPWVRRESE